MDPAMDVKQESKLPLNDVLSVSLPEPETPFVRKYSDSLIEEVLEFTEKNSLSETARYFNIPHSTIYTWQKKLSHTASDGPVKGNPSQVKNWKVEPEAHEAKESDTSEETKDAVVAFAKKHKSYQQASKKFGFSAASIKEWARMRRAVMKEDKAVVVKSEKKSRGGGGEEKVKRVREYSDQVKKAAVIYGKKHGWTAAAIKFKTSSTSVSRWATYHDPRSPWKLKVIMAAQIIGSKEASKKFKVAQSTLEEWIQVSGKFCPKLDHDYMDMDYVEYMDGGNASYVKEEAEELEESCEVCGEDIKHSETFLEHLAAHHLTEDGLCGVCGSNEEDLEAHFRIHMEDTFSEDNDEDPDVQDLLKDLLVDD